MQSCIEKSIERTRLGCIVYGACSGRTVHQLQLQLHFIDLSVTVYRFGFNFTHPGPDAGAPTPGLHSATADTLLRMEAHPVLKSLPSAAQGAAWTSAEPTLGSTWTGARGHLLGTHGLSPKPS